MNRRILKTFTANTLAVTALVAGTTLISPALTYAQEAPDAAQGEEATQDPPIRGITGTVTFARETRLKKVELVNVIVSVEGLRLEEDALAEALESREPSVIDQEDMTFVPHVLPILIGEAVEFNNGDPIYHNVYPATGEPPFNLGMYPNAEPQATTFEEPAIVEIKCAVHSEMQAFIVVKENPYFASVQEDGTFTIEGVPAGVQQLQLWHPETEPVTIEVTVPEDEAVEIEAEIMYRLGEGEE